MDNKQQLKVVSDQNQAPAIQSFGKLAETLAERLGLDPDDLIPTIKTQCFPNGAASPGQLFMLMSFARQYDLNPLARECYAFIGSGGKMQVGVQADGWSKIANREENYDGQEIEYHTDQADNVIAITTKTHVKGRQYPTVYRAEMKEWKRNTDVWNQMPVHQLYLKARDEGIRFAFGIPAYDPDDLERMEHAAAIDVTPNESQKQLVGPAARAQLKIAPEELKQEAKAEPQPVEGSAAEANQANKTPSIETEQNPTEVSGSQQASASADPTGIDQSVSTDTQTASDAPNDEASLRAELDKLIDRAPPARVQILYGQQGVTDKKQLTIEQVKTVIRLLSKGKK